MKKIETKSTVLLAHHLKALKMPTMFAECEKVAALCSKDNVDHLGFLLQLCELELLERERKAATRRLKAARFPNQKTLDTFDFAAQPSVNKVHVSELVRCEYIDKRDIDNIRGRVLNTEKIRRILRWAPRYSLMNGLKRTKEWFDQRAGASACNVDRVSR